jgi:penicillin-binding protein 1A
VNQKTDQSTGRTRKFWKWYFVSAGVFMLFILLLNFGWIGDMPDLDDIENPTASLASQVYAPGRNTHGKILLRRPY